MKRDTVELVLYILTLFTRVIQENFRIEDPHKISYTQSHQAMNIQCDECIVVITRPKSLLSFFGCFIAVVAYHFSSSIVDEMGLLHKSLQSSNVHMYLL